jgi:hypothetical protein
MHRVEKDHIKNEHIRNLFGVADIHDELQIRSFRWLGQLARQPDVTATKRLLSAWIATLVVAEHRTLLPAQRTQRHYALSLVPPS